MSHDTIWIETVNIRAPVPGTCRLCAAKHDPAAPHDRDSLYYLMLFFQKHRRFPTWDDAMAHCSEAIKAQVRRELEDQCADGPVD